jgi:hypothetical protein
MATPWIIGNWTITQDSPEYGCDDNPSYEWFANEYKEGHWTGRSLRFPTEYDMRVHFLGRDAA